MAEDDIVGRLEKQVAELRGELEKVTKSLADGGFELIDDAKDAAQGAGKLIRRKAGELAEEAQSEIAAVAQVARENPSATSAVLTVVALAAFLAGVVVGANNPNFRRHRW